MTDEQASRGGNQKRKKRTESIHVDPNDILLGRGKSFKNHPGNIRFQGTLKDFLAYIRLYLTMTTNSQS